MLKETSKGKQKLMEKQYKKHKQRGNTFNLSILGKKNSKMLKMQWHLFTTC
jgi:hypothetical protein